MCIATSTKRLVNVVIYYNKSTLIVEIRLSNAKSLDPSKDVREMDRLRAALYAFPIVFFCRHISLKARCDAPKIQNGGLYIFFK